MTARVKNPRPCEQCGELTDKGRRPNKPLLCVSCGLMNAVSAARQMHDKQGPMWDAYLANPGRRAPARPN